MGSASSDSGIIEAGGVASSAIEDRLRRLELMEERREAAMAEFRKQVDRVEQAQAEMRITQDTILLREVANGMCQQKKTTSTMMTTFKRIGCGCT